MSIRVTVRGGFICKDGYWLAACYMIVSIKRGEHPFRRKDIPLRKEWLN